MIDVTIKGKTAEEIFWDIVQMLDYIKTELLPKQNPASAPTTTPPAPTPAANTVLLTSNAPAVPQSSIAPPPPAVPVAPPVPAATVPVAPPVTTPAPAAAVPAPAVPVVPTAAPTYTFEAIAKAGADLIQLGKMQETTALLQKYGVQSLNDLPPEKYGLIAMDLRALGAKI